MRTILLMAAVVLIVTIESHACSTACPETAPEPDSRALGNILRDKAHQSPFIFIGTYDSTVAYVSEPQFDPAKGEYFTETIFFFRFTVHRRIKGWGPEYYLWEKWDLIERKYESIETSMISSCFALRGEDFFKGKPILIFSDYSNDDVNPGLNLPVCSDFRNSRTWFEVEQDRVIYNPMADPGEAPETYSLTAFEQDATTSLRLQRIHPSRAGFLRASLPMEFGSSSRRLDGRVIRRLNSR